MLIVNAIVVAFAILTASGNKIKTSNDIYEIVSIFTAIFAFVVPFLGASIFIFIYLCRRFYNTMYSSQGYLTLTLPVKKTSIFNCKLLASVMWEFVSAFTMFICLIIYIASISGDSFIDVMANFFDSVVFSDVVLLVFHLLNYMLGMLQGILLVFTAITLGQMSNSHKIDLAVVGGFGLVIGEGMITGIVQTIVMQFITAGQEYYHGDNFYVIFRFITTVVWIVLEYLTCIYIIKNKVNLA